MEGWDLEGLGEETVVGLEADCYWWVGVERWVGGVWRGG